MDNGTGYAPGTIVATFRADLARAPLVVAPGSIGSPAHTLALERAGVDLEKFDPGGYESVLTAAWGAALVEGSTRAMTVEAFALELASLEVEIPDVPPTAPRSEKSPGSRSRSGSTRKGSSTVGTGSSGARSASSSTAKQKRKGST